MIPFPSATFCPNKQIFIRRRESQSCSRTRLSKNEKFEFAAILFRFDFFSGWSFFVEKTELPELFRAQHANVVVVVVVMKPVRMSLFKLYLVFFCCFVDQWRPIASEAEAQTFFVQTRQSRSNPIQEGFFKLPAEYQQKRLTYNQPNGMIIFSVHLICARAVLWWWWSTG